MYYSLLIFFGLLVIRRICIKRETPKRRSLHGE